MVLVYGYSLRPCTADYSEASRDIGRSMAVKTGTICQRHPEPRFITQGRLDQPTRKEEKRKSEGSRTSLSGSPTRHVFDAPSIRLSLNWLRPRRASFCFTEPSDVKQQNNFEHQSHATKNPGGSGAGPRVNKHTSKKLSQSR